MEVLSLLDLAIYLNPRERNKKNRKKGENLEVRQGKRSMVAGCLKGPWRKRTKKKRRPIAAKCPKEQNSKNWSTKEARTIGKNHLLK